MFVQVFRKFALISLVLAHLSISSLEAAEPELAAAAEDAEAEKRQLNPRPEGEAELLSEHAVEPPQITFKPGTGLVVKSKDGKFSMGIRTRVQIRDEISSYGEIEQTSTGETTEVHGLDNTFGIRRARLQFKGNVFGKHNKYKLELAFSPSDLGYINGSITRTPLLSYYVEFDHLRDLSLRLGQYKLYYSRQRVISSGDLELVDRTVAQAEFNLDRDVGFHFFSKDLFGLGHIKYYAGITVGEGRDIWLAEDIKRRELGGAQYLARLEILPFGQFNDYSEVDFERENRFRLSIGMAYAYLSDGYRKRGYQGSAFDDGGRVAYHNANADLFFKWAGLTGLVEGYFREGERDTSVADYDLGNLPRNGVGGSVQLGYLIPRLPLGIAGRYSMSGLGPFEAARSALRSTHEAGGGVSWYFAGHDLKLQADYFHYWGESFDRTDINRIRLQLQLAY